MKNDSMTAEEKMRAEFEAEVLKTGGHIGRLPCGTYSDPVTTSAWWAWQACASQYSATIARLEDECDIANRACIKLNQQLAAAELSNRQLREALDEAAEATGYVAVHPDMERWMAILAQSISTEALDAYVASNYAVRYMRPNSQKWTSEQWAAFGAMADEYRSSSLYKDGDAILVWVNEGDICRIGKLIEPAPLPPSSDKKD